MEDVGGKALLDELQKKTDQALRQSAGTDEPYGLVDFPNHANIGDSAIWLGETTMLQAIYGRAPSYAATAADDVAEIGRFLKSGTLFLHGGGNFGDLWPRHQLYREHILQAYPHLQIIQLPQSIHFSDPSAIDSTRRAIGGHRNFILMVRDTASLEFASQHFDCPVQLVPDCALGIDMRQFLKAGTGQGIRCLFRTDKEMREDAATAAQLFEGMPIEDWVGLSLAPSPFQRQMQRVWRHAERLPPRSYWMHKRISRLNRLAEARVAQGFSQLSQARVIVTDRLHGHIMSSLLRRPHVVIDNFYGKIASYIETWSAVPDCRVARDYTTARREAESLLHA
jgi:exopolysaccharide biosynthesis predicted pyruvyltransferase EpsI